MTMLQAHAKVVFPEARIHIVLLATSAMKNTKLSRCQQPR